MKPRVTLSETTLPNGAVMTLHEHDGRHYLSIDGVETAGPRTRVSEFELGALACSPFRPVRQPQVWITGLGLGAVLEGAQSVLQQKRATFHLAEPCAALPGWLREHLDGAPFLDDPRIAPGTDPGPDGLARHRGELHAILSHADTAPAPDPRQPLHEDRRWLATAYDALRDGGLLAIASSQPLRNFGRSLERAGFTPARHEINATPKARRPRVHSLWLGRKGDART